MSLIERTQDWYDHAFHAHDRERAAEFLEALKAAENVLAANDRVEEAGCFMECDSGEALDNAREELREALK